MTKALLTAPLLRLAVFSGVQDAMAGWALAAPCRRQDILRITRWITDLGRVAVDTVNRRFSDRPALVRHPEDRL